MEARAAAALTLRDFDAGLRRVSVPKAVGKIGVERRKLAKNLRDLGGEPWPYSPMKDNSWVVG